MRWRYLSKSVGIVDERNRAVFLPNNRHRSGGMAVSAQDEQADGLVHEQVNSFQRGMIHHPRMAELDLHFIQLVIGSERVCSLTTKARNNFPSCYIIPPPTNFSIGTSATMHSLVSIRPATLAAFCNA